MLSDIEIAQAVKSEPIVKIAEKLNINEKDLIPYGWNKAKVEPSAYIDKKRKGKLILVTAINPTPAGEGKTTTSIGLADALSQLGKNACLALREPSLGPVFGVKGGATGGGYAQVVPMEDINLHFTGDFHAIGAANNLLAAMIDNHIQQGNSLNIDVKSITWKRCVDMNDRQLRNIVDGLGGKMQGVPREDGFDITVASEIMAIFCLATDLMDLKKRLGKIIIGYSYDGKPITAHDLKAEGAMTALLKDALKPNLVQTLEGTLAFIHGGPFANIAHGCNSVIATDAALKLSDYVVTEAGFGADLGAEKFLDIKCRCANIRPSAVVLVATIRALKYHGGVKKEDLNKENVDAVKEGMSHLFHYYSVLRHTYGIPFVISINKFVSDTKNEINIILNQCKTYGIPVVLSDVWGQGGKGGLDLAKEVLNVIDTSDNNFKYIYDLKDTIEEKIYKVAKRVYGVKDVSYSNQAKKEIERLTELGFGNVPICIAKTQYSQSDDATKLNSVSDVIVNVKKVKVSSGAGFIVVYMGDIMTMPGLPKKPAAEGIDVDKNGVISGLF